MPERHNQCPSCRSSLFTSDANAARSLGLKEPFEISRCTDCAMRWLNPRPTEAEYAQLYDKSYFGQEAPSLDSTERWMTDYPAPPQHTRRFSDAFKPSLNAHNDRMLDRFDEDFKQPGHLLEIGCGHGEFLIAARGRGWTVSGIEPSEKASRQANEVHDLDVRHGRLGEISFDKSFDAIYLSHVFEHLLEPKQALASIVGMMSPEATLIIVVPNQFEAWIRKLAAIARLRRPLQANIYSIHHPMFYGPSQLGHLLSEAGLDFDLRTHLPYELKASRFTMGLRWLNYVADRAAKQGTNLEFTARRLE